MNGGRVLLASPRSFCAGVDRAIEIVERLLAEHGPPVYVRHQIVHNDHVVGRLERLGAVFVDHEDEIPAGEICVLSAHGVAPDVKQRCEQRGPPRGRRCLPARLEGARRGAPVRRLRPSRRARRARRSRRGDRHARRAARVDRRDRVARGRARAGDRRQAGRRDHPDDALARRRGTDRGGARVPARSPDAAGRGRHLLRDPEPPGRGQAARGGGDADPRDRLGDELERPAARRGRPGGRRRGGADRRRERPRRRDPRRPCDGRGDRRGVDARGARRGCDRAARGRRLRRPRGGHGRARGRPLPPPREVA